MNGRRPTPDISRHLRHLDQIVFDSWNEYAAFHTGDVQDPEVLFAAYVKAASKYTEFARNTQATGFYH